MVKSKHIEVILAGFGGQGVLSAGYLLAYAAMLEGMHVSWLPSYGPEMRGGTANCSVIISDEPIGSPIIRKASALIAMNTPSAEKFEGIVEKNGVIVYDSSIVRFKPSRTDARYYAVPATKIAEDLGNVIYTNMVLMGRMTALMDILEKESIVRAVERVLPVNKHHLIPDNLTAFEKGLNYN